MTTQQVAADAWSILAETQATQYVQPDQYLKAGEIVGTANADGADMRISDMNFKGYVYVWDTVTGDRSMQPRNLLWQTFRRIRPNGTPFYMLTDPHIAPNYGENLTCPLTPGESLAGKGFKMCNDGRGKRHIPTQDALDRHVKKAHKRAYEAMEREKVDQNRREDRELQLQAIATQNKLLEAMLQNQTGASGQQVASKK